jgi:hypothetical protein
VRERRQHDLPFEQREVIPDADPLAVAEGQPRRPVPRGFGLGCESIGIEALRIRVDARVVVKAVCRYQDDRAGGDLVPTEGDVRERLAAEGASAGTCGGPP